jgi:hypothetical protein
VPEPPAPPALRFGSWAGGDMDGNPAVGAVGIARTLALHRTTALRLLHARVDALACARAHPRAHAQEWRAARQQSEMRRRRCVRDLPDADVLRKRLKYVVEARRDSSVPRQPDRDITGGVLAHMPLDAHSRGSRTCCVDRINGVGVQTQLGVVALGGRGREQGFKRPLASADQPDLGAGNAGATSGHRTLVLQQREEHTGTHENYRAR